MGKIIWLEKGYVTTTNAAGLKHILKEHGSQFVSGGIPASVIGTFVLNAVAYGEIVGYQGKGTGRPIYEYNYGGKTYHVAVTVGSDGDYLRRKSYIRREMEKMKTIKLSLEYGAWPLWLLDEKGQVIDTAMPEEWADEKNLESLLDELQRLHESQFVDDGKAFECRGFADENEKKRYLALLQEARERITKIIPDDWVFIDGTIG
jgi:hypothetical protein